MGVVRTDLPGGTVTFVFTDIAGSTVLLRELGEKAYAQVLTEHRELVRAKCPFFPVHPLRRSGRTGPRGSRPACLDERLSTASQSPVRSRWIDGRTL
jgi:hypothetical protein